MADLDVVCPEGGENSLSLERIKRPFHDDADRKSLKRDEKKRSKEQKSSKKRKAQDRNAREIPYVDEEKDSHEVTSTKRAPDGPSVVNETRDIPISIDVTKKMAQVSKVDFFAALSASESQKPAVGTVHTVGKKVEKDKKDSNWTCPKCSTSNQNNSHQCHKCKAVKRMTEYR